MSKFQKSLCFTVIRRIVSAIQPSIATDRQKDNVNTANNRTAVAFSLPADMRLMRIPSPLALVEASCEDEVMAQLVELQRERFAYEQKDGRLALDLREREMQNVLNGPLLERAIGAIYLPETERISHYFYARLPRQFDFVLHFDQTRAVEPFERIAEAAEEPETYSSGI